MKAHHECREACIAKPLLKLDTRTSLTIKDLLLSATTTGPNVSPTEVSKAFDELIDLQYPLINRILELAAYLCANRRLYIYCANADEFSSLRTSDHNAGFYTAANALIVLSQRLPLSQLLIHELTHAVRDTIKVDLEHSGTIDHHQLFCKSEFPTFFMALKREGPTEDEREELTSLSDRYHALCEQSDRANRSTSKYIILSCDYISEEEEKNCIKKCVTEIKGHCNAECFLVY